jgi:hypothetical protein
MKATTSKQLILPLLFVVLAAAAPQDPYSFVRRQLSEDTGEMHLNGWHLSHDVMFGALDDGESEVTTAVLRANRTYYIIGECDYDCDDFDMSLYNERGVFIKEDVQPDDYSVLAVTPTRDRTFQIQARMAACAEDPCVYGVAIYTR